MNVSNEIGSKYRSPYFDLKKKNRSARGLQNSYSRGAELRTIKLVEGD